MTLGVLVRRADGGADLYADRRVSGEFVYETCKIIRAGDHYYILAGDARPVGVFTHAVTVNMESAWAAALQIELEEHESFGGIVYSARDQQAAYLGAGYLDSTSEPVLATGCGAVAALACLRAGADIPTTFEVVSSLLPSVGAEYDTVEVPVHGAKR